MKQFEITSFLESKFPNTLASQFDIGKVGLQFGSKDKQIHENDYSTRCYKRCYR